MKKPVTSYQEQILQAKATISRWSAEQRSWMQPQGTNEFVERRMLDTQQDSRLLASDEWFPDPVNPRS